VLLTSCERPPREVHAHPKFDSIESILEAARPGEHFGSTPLQEHLLTTTLLREKGELH